MIVVGAASYRRGGVPRSAGPALADRSSARCSDWRPSDALMSGQRLHQALADRGDPVAEVSRPRGGQLRGTHQPSLRNRLRRRFAPGALQAGLHGLEPRQDQFPHLAGFRDAHEWTRVQSDTGPQMLHLT
jgi:hypothetical protein